MERHVYFARFWDEVASSEDGGHFVTPRATVVIRHKSDHFNNCTTYGQSGELFDNFQYI